VQERWEDERQKLLSDLEVERNKRVEAQERSVIVTPWGHAVWIFCFLQSSRHPLAVSLRFVEHAHHYSFVYIYQHYKSIPSSNQTSQWKIPPFMDDFSSYKL